jgi:hypothetical protein
MTPQKPILDWDNEMELCDEPKIKVVLDGQIFRID